MPKERKLDPLDPLDPSSPTTLPEDLRSERVRRIETHPVQAGEQFDAGPTSYKEVEPLVEAIVDQSIHSGPYLSAPLDLGSDSIRLIELLPDSDASRVKCLLKSYASTTECPQYVALLYKWDHISPQDTIELNGVPRVDIVSGPS